jgi:ABC-type nitrate/sulfonate/bicarbonate transport system permease component
VTGWLIRLSPLLLLALLACVWETASRLGWTDPRLLPPFLDVMKVLGHLLQDSRFLGDLALTMQEIAVAFLLVGPLGLGTGFLIGESEAVNRAIGPLINLLLSIPKSIFLPIFTLAFGIGFLQKVLFAVTLAFFIVVLSGIAAARSVPAGMVQAARAFGATRLQIYLRVYLPAMEPLIVEGLRMAMIFTITGVLLAEMYGAPHGIGRLIFAWGELAKMPELFASVILVVGLTVIFNELMRLVEDMRRLRRRGNQ